MHLFNIQSAFPFERSNVLHLSSTEIRGSNPAQDTGKCHRFFYCPIWRSFAMNRSLIQPG